MTSWMSCPRSIEQVVDRGVELLRVDAETDRERALGVEVDDEDLATQLGQRGARG